MSFPKKEAGQTVSIILFSSDPMMRNEGTPVEIRISAPSPKCDEGTASRPVVVIHCSVAQFLSSSLQQPKEKHHHCRLLFRGRTSVLPFEILLLVDCCWLPSIEWTAKTNKTTELKVYSTAKHLPASTFIIIQFRHKPHLQCNLRRSSSSRTAGKEIRTSTHS